MVSFVRSWLVIGSVESIGSIGWNPPHWSIFEPMAFRLNSSMNNGRKGENENFALAFICQFNSSKRKQRSHIPARCIPKSIVFSSRSITLTWPAVRNSTSPVMKCLISSKPIPPGRLDWTFGPRIWKTSGKTGIRFNDSILQKVIPTLVW